MGSGGNNKIKYSHGQLIGTLEFIKDEKSVMKGKYLARMAQFKCVCGKLFICSIASIKKGNTKSCGCLRKEITSKLNIKHGHGVRGKESKEFIAWIAMISRCESVNAAQYKDYGGRGISVCERWKSSFKLFLLDMGEKPSDRHSLDRFPDKNGNYEPKNCRWATKEEQANNKTNNVMIKYNNSIKTLPEWVRELGLKYNLTYQRLFFLKWPIEKAFINK